MSHKIGIVSEGISDYWILKHIVERYLKDSDVYTIPLKPKITPKGKQKGFGTWQGVFNYISGNDGLILEAVSEGCEFVIVQIDTDVCAEYGVKQITDASQLWDNVKTKLEKSFPATFDKSKIIYAICIHEIECWLIPFVSIKKEECCNTNRCLNILNKNIKANLGLIDKDNKNCDAVQSIYNCILKKKKKSKDISEVSKYNYGFQTFIAQLNKIIW